MRRPSSSKRDGNDTEFAVSDDESNRPHNSSIVSSKEISLQDQNPNEKVFDEEVATPATPEFQSSKEEQLGQDGCLPEWRYLDQLPAPLIMLEEIVAHTLYPVSLIWMIPLRGMTWALNKGFITGCGYLSCPKSKDLGKSFMSVMIRRFFLSLSIWNLYWSPFVINFVILTTRRELFKEFAMEVAILNFLFVYRTCFTALRYALLDDESRRIIYYSTDQERVRETQRSSSLAGGYFALPKTLRRSLLELSASELAIDLSERIEISLEKKNVMIGENLSTYLNSLLQPLTESNDFRPIFRGSNDGDFVHGSISLKEIANLLIDSVVGNIKFEFAMPFKNKVSRRIFIWSAFLGIAIPLIIRLRFYKDPHADWAYILLLILTMLSTTTHLEVLSSIVFIAIYGMYRQAILAKFMVMLICPSSTAAEPVTLDVFRIVSSAWKISPFYLI